MRKTRYHISKMDCSAEASIVEMKLRDFQSVRKLEFDVPNRSLVVFHEGSSDDEISKAVGELNFGSKVVSSEDHFGGFESEDIQGNTRLLWTVLAINLFFFLVETAFGYIGHSMGLIADGLDMLADALVYGLSLIAVGGAVAGKKRVAAVSGYLQFLLAGIGMFEVLNRFFSPGETPSFPLMVSVSLCALSANILTLWLLNKAKSGEAHIRASAICTSNDVIANMGVILAGALVMLTHTSYPDLVIGFIVFLMVGRGAFAILKLAK